MSMPVDERDISAQGVRAILAVTTALAAPFDLITMLAEVVKAAKQVLGADRGSVWLYDAATDELVLEVATGIQPVRVRAGTGLAGTCARSRAIINVPDCYADPRFDPSVDRSSGYRTRCMLTLPLIDHKDVLVGVMQVLNKRAGVFDQDDEVLATALAAQCAVALQRVRMTEAVLEGEKLRQELETARVVQMSTLPATMPAVGGYDVYGTFMPAALTGGDTFDLAMLGSSLLVVLADATGHGIAPALSVTQMHAMLRIAFRLGADLETAFLHVNNQLAATLAEDRFITAFIGVLDPAVHRIRFHSGGQGPILRFDAAKGVCDVYKPTSFPLGAMPLASMKPAVNVDLRPGDVVLLLSDGIYEYCNSQGEEFGVARVEQLVAANHRLPAAGLSRVLLHAIAEFAAGAPQEDDITIVIVKREGMAAASHAEFVRDFACLPAIFAFTADFFSREAVPAALLSAVDFALEELFTNMVKYSPSGSPTVAVDIAVIPGGVTVSITDRDVEPFDVTRAAAVDVNLPLEQRRPGGLGLHLVRHLVEDLDYAYAPDTRSSRITFRKTVGGPSAGGTGDGAGRQSVLD